MSMLDKLKGLLGKSPEQAQAGGGTTTPAADEQTSGRHSDTSGQAGETAPGSAEGPSGQDSPEQGGPGGEARQ